MLRTRLFASTALATFALVGTQPVFAAEKLSLKVGGYMEQFFGYTNQNKEDEGSDFSGFDVKSDTEIFFRGSTTLDNGIEFGVNVQLEGNSSSDAIDESYMIVKGAFGELNIGSENSAMYKLHIAPRNFGFGMNSGDNVEWLNFDSVGGNTGVFRGPFGSTFLEPGRVNDANRITYYTPRFGFGGTKIQLGGSFVPDSQEDSNAIVNHDSDLNNGVTGGAQLRGKYGDFELFASAGLGVMQSGDQSDDADPTAYNLGLKFRYKGWEAGASYGEALDDQSIGDSTGLMLGVSYVAPKGPWSLSLSGFLADRDGDPDARNGGSGPREANYDTVQLEGAYALGPGVSFVGTLGYAELRDQTNQSPTNEAVYAVSQLRLSF